MNLNDIIAGKPGEKLFMLGNEAAVRAVIESGISVAATYPGTPSSEIGDILSKVAKDTGIYFEFSVNEKVAMEVAAAASLSGVRSFTFMKHVGLNVASDSFMSTPYTTVNGGMIILSADDPSMFSSQNEQDNRHYARLANVPLLEPSNPQEIKDYVILGFELSEKYNIPIIVRTTTRVSHMRGVVELGEVPQKSTDGNEKGFFDKNPAKYVPVPVNSMRMHKELVEKMATINEFTNNSDLNKIYYKNEEYSEFNFENSKLGIIASGSAFNYAYDVIKELDIDVPILKLGFTYPFPDDIVLNFIKSLDQVLISEEVDPIMESEVLRIVGKYHLDVEIKGKLDDSLPMTYEYNQNILENALVNILNLDLPTKEIKTSDIELPNRPPTLCPGCPHRSVYYAVKKAIKNLGIDEKDVIFPSDIGCYTLGIEAPYETVDLVLAMGASVGSSCGFARATNQKIMSFLGDSTFFHSGVAPLINATHNKHKFVLTVLDNRITAMTGGQPNPGVPVDGMGDEAPQISIEEVARACGVDFVETVNPEILKSTVKVYEKAIKHDGVAVVVSRHPCVLIQKRSSKKAKIQVDYKKCTNCNECIEEFACPAIYKDDDGKVVIDQSLCVKCAVCVQLCEKKAIVSRM